MKRSLALLACLGLPAAPLLAQTPPAPAPAPSLAPAAAMPTATDPATVVAAAVQTLMLARQIAALGVEKAPGAATKQLSLDVGTTYGAALAELSAAAAAAGLGVPRTLDKASRDAAELLQSSFETQFEQEYLDVQIASHTRAVALAAALSPAALPQGLVPALTKVTGLLVKSLDGFKDAKRKLPGM